MFNEQDDLMYSSSEIIDQFFRKVDCALDKLMSEKSEETLVERLSRFYWSSWYHLKRRNGTSAGWPWFGEYLVFYVMKSHLEMNRGCKFNVVRDSKHGSTRDIWVFVDDAQKPDLYLAHNAKLPKLNDDQDYYRPDILLLKDKWAKKQLLFAIDVKVGITGKSALEKVLTNLSRVHQQDAFWKLYDKRLCYLVVLDETLSVEDDQLLSKLNKSCVKVVGPRCGTLAERANITTLEDCFVEIDSVLSRLDQ